MIVFDLKCLAEGHVFEAWFGSSADYDSQRARGLVECPICGAAEVERLPSAPAVPAKGDRPDAKQLLESLAAAQREALKGSEWVGRNFADEARSIHLGEAQARAIHGEATRADARALREEGVPVAPLPIPVVPPAEKN